MQPALTDTVRTDTGPRAKVRLCASKRNDVRATSRITVGNRTVRMAEKIMATSEFWQRVSASVSSPEWSRGASGPYPRNARGTSKFWVLLDAFTVLGAAILATLYEFKLSPIAEVRSFWRGTLIQGRPMGILLTLLCGFIVSLIIIS